MLRHKYNSIIRDFRNNWIFLIIFAVGCIPSILHGYSMYLLILLFPIILLKSSVRLTPPLVCSILFGVLYTFPLYLHKVPPTPSNAIFYLTYPALFYMIPTYLIRKFRNPESIFIVLIIAVTCIASWSVSVNIEDTLVSGQLVNFRRALSENLKDIQGVTSATNHNMMLSLAIGGVGMIFITAQNGLERRIKLFLIILSAFAIFSAFHLLNRTAIVLVGVSCIVALLVGGLTPRRMIAVIFTVILLGIVFALFLDNSQWLTDVLNGFESREENSKFGMATGGGRDIRWLAALTQIPNHPLGADALYFMGQSTYAHNTWLDCAIQSGWLPFILLIYVTYDMVKNVFYYIRNKRISIFKRAYIAIIVSVMIMQLMVEPVIQGVYLLLLMMFFIWSYTYNLNIKFYHRNEKVGNFAHGS